MGINKVQYGNTTLIDLTSDTVTAEQLMQGYTAHDRTGALIIGTATGGSGDGYVWQDGNGYVHLSDEQGTQTIIDALTVDASGTYTAPTGHAYSPVTVPSGTEGTPTATKGAVSNHSVSVTPSVTNASGYITGNTKTGTAVTVSASELVSGSQTITSNQTVDVTNLAELVVNVSGSGGGLEYEAGTWTPATDISNPTISFQNAHTEAPVFVMISDATGSYDGTTYTCQSFVYGDWEKAFGATINPSTSSSQYALLRGVYRGASATATSNTGTIFISRTSAETYVNSSRFVPNIGSGYYWRTNRTYKWIAVWAPTT